MFIQIEDSVLLSDRINSLTRKTPAVFGKMTSQHMLEHLGFTMMLSNGKQESKLYVPEEKAKVYKNILLYTDTKMPRGIKTPLLSDEPPPWKFRSLEDAAAFLMQQVGIYLVYESENPYKRHMHPKLGLLTMKEWHIFHNKHFTHHFEQFGLGL